MSQTNNHTTVSATHSCRLWLVRRGKSRKRNRRSWEKSESKQVVSAVWPVDVLRGGLLCVIVSVAAFGVAKAVCVLWNVVPWVAGHVCAFGDARAVGILDAAEGFWRAGSCSSMGSCVCVCVSVGLYDGFVQACCKDVVEYIHTYIHTHIHCDISDKHHTVCWFLLTHDMKVDVYVYVCASMCVYTYYTCTCAHTVCMHTFVRCAWTKSTQTTCETEWVPSSKQ